MSSTPKRATDDRYAKRVAPAAKCVVQRPVAINEQRTHHEKRVGFSCDENATSNHSIRFATRTGKYISQRPLAKFVVQRPVAVNEQQAHHDRRAGSSCAEDAAAEQTGRRRIGALEQFAADREAASDAASMQSDDECDTAPWGMRQTESPQSNGGFPRSGMGFAVCHQVSLRSGGSYITAGRDVASMQSDDEYHTAPWGMRQVESPRRNGGCPRSGMGFAVCHQVSLRSGGSYKTAGRDAASMQSDDEYGTAAWGMRQVESPRSNGGFPRSGMGFAVCRQVSLRSGGSYAS